MNIKGIVASIQSKLTSLWCAKVEVLDVLHEKSNISDKWRQGDILSDKLAESIIERLEVDVHCSPLRDFSKNGVLILVSQDCDLVQRSYEKEPFAEAIWGYSKDENKVDNVNSPREISLPSGDDSSSLKYVFEDRNRVVFPRCWLEGEPIGRRMYRDGLKKLIRMILRRYDRQPLPTEFNKRLKKAGVEKKITKLLRNTQEELSGVAIYIRLNTWNELTDKSAFYTVSPVAVHRKSLSSDEKMMRNLRILINGIKEEGDENGEYSSKKPKRMSDAEWYGIVGLTENCKEHGIVLAKPEDLSAPFSQCDHILSERLFTLDHRYEYKPWEYDYLSPDENDSVPLSPHSY